LLTAEQLAAAILHERAHAAAFDNLKRLLLAFTPGMIPGIHGFAALERQWARYTELAADDDAVAGDPHRALALASALVRVARLGVMPAPLASSLLDGDGLTERVERLLHPVPYSPSCRGLTPALAAAGAAAVCASGWALRPNSLQSAYRLLEQLVR
jgi:Zn-dependent protease with chaperone function